MGQTVHQYRIFSIGVLSDNRSITILLVRLEKPFPRKTSALLAISISTAWSISLSVQNSWRSLLVRTSFHPALDVAGGGTGWTRIAPGGTPSVLGPSPSVFGKLGGVVVDDESSTVVPSSTTGPSPDWTNAFFSLSTQSFFPFVNTKTLSKPGCNLRISLSLRTIWSISGQHLLMYKSWFFPLLK